MQYTFKIAFLPQFALHRTGILGYSSDDAQQICSMPIQRQPRLTEAARAMYDSQRPLLTLDGAESVQFRIDIDPQHLVRIQVFLECLHGFGKYVIVAQLVAQCIECN